jgi:peptide deformylase
MSRLHPSVLIWPDPILQQRAEQVTRFDENLAQTIIDMMLILKKVDGIGLSACQIGDPRNFFIYKIKDEEGVMVNPEITERSEETHTLPEGCLSFPGVYVKVSRHDEITVVYRDEEGQQHSRVLTGLLGDCIQHEVDHLNGRTILNHLSKLKRDVVTGKLKKLKRQIKQQRAHDNKENLAASRG